MPLTKGPHPAVVIVGGAGPSTRRTGEATQLFFVSQGIAVLTYDKRGAGESTGKLDEASFEDLADDMLAGVRALRRRSDINPRQIGVRGASEGGWVAPLCAARSNGEVAFVISISAGGLGPAEQEVRRVEVQMRGDGFPESEVKEASRVMRLKFDYARTQKGWEEYEAAARRASTKEWFPYVLAPLSKDDPDWEFGRKIVRYDPLPVLEKVRCPILILLGDLDWNYLNEAKEESVAEKALRLGGNRDFTFEVFHAGNHALWLGKTGGVLEFPFLKSYVPGYFQKQSDWLLKRVNVPSSK
jgi:pimeloyl-ACP methyl ester carboxylesterase